jgi:putative transposase
MSRDENAAKVLLARGLKIASSTLGHSGINAQGQTNLCQLSESLIDKLTG